MKKFLFIPFLCCMFSLTELFAQQIDCTFFCVQGMYMDTASPNTMWISIEFTGSENDFINYPHVPAVLNSEGDTVAMGTLWFFGQIGNTIADYPVMTVWDSIPEEFTGTVIFRYDTMECELAFPCLFSGTAEPHTLYNIELRPNPATEQTTLYTSIPLMDGTILVYTMEGKLILRLDHLQGKEFPISLATLPSGVYTIQLSERNKVMATKKFSKAGE